MNKDRQKPVWPVGKPKPWEEKSTVRPCLFGFESKRDSNKMPLDRPYICKPYPQTKEQYNRLINANVNPNKIAFYPFDSNVPLTPTDQTQINGIIKMYEKILESGDSLEDIWKYYFEKALKEPTDAEVDDFLKYRADDFKNHPEYDANGKYSSYTCDWNIKWSEFDDPLNGPKSSCDLFDNHVPGYVYLKEYVPEKFNHNIDARPTVLGFLDEQDKYDKCQKYFRTKFSSETLVSAAKWSLELNKVFIHCILQSSPLIFPFQLIDPQFEKIGRYSSFNPTKTYEYVGVLCVPFKDDRPSPHPTKRFVFFVFRESDGTTSKLTLFNHRQNRITTGSFFEEFRVTYVELNQLYYYSLNHHLYTYLYTPSKTSKKIYLFSHHNKSEIERIYRETYGLHFSDTDIKKLLNNLELVHMVKDNERKILIFKEEQTGGDLINNKSDLQYGIKNVLGLRKTGHMHQIHLSHQSNMEPTVGPTQYYFDPDVYPDKLFARLITDFNDIKSKFKSQEEFIEAISIVYKYHFLKKQFVLKHVIDPDIYSYVHNKKYKPIIDIGMDKILLYDFFYPETITLLEYFINFDLFGKKSKSLFITRTAGYLEAACFYIQKYLAGNNFSRIMALIPSFPIGHNYKFSAIKGVIDLFNIQFELVDRPFNNDILTNLISHLGTYDFVHIDPAISDIELQCHRDQLNHTHFVSQMILGLSVLKSGGNLLCTIPGITTRVTAEMVHYLCGLFEKSYIYHPETMQNSYQFYAIVCFGYKETPSQSLWELNQKMHQIDPTGFAAYNVLDDTVRHTYRINKKIDSNTQRSFIESFAPYTDSVFDSHILRFNKDYLRHFKDFIRRLNEYYDNKDDTKYIDYMTSVSLSESISIAQKMDLEIKPGVLTLMSSDKFYRKLIQSMYSYDNIIKFIFRKETIANVSISPRIAKLSPALKRLSVDFYLAAQIIDTRDPDLYDLVKKYIRYYERSLGDKLKAKHNISLNGRRVSRAWLKFREIVTEVPLLKNMSELKSFHICEAPGTFIMSLDRYAKEQNTKLNWTAQSLRESKIFDDYGLIAKNPSKWDFGPKDTGDITDPDNIRYYLKKYADQNLQLITADCGTSWDERDLSSKLKYSMIILILGLLGTGGNFVFKTLMPLNEHSIISLYYLIYIHFEQLIFFKPLQNAWSPEFYVIGLNYQNKIDNTDMDLMIKQLDSYNRKVSLVDTTTENYSKFMIQLESITSKLKNNFRIAILRNIFFVDNWSKLDSDEKAEIKKNIEDRNDDWIKRFIQK